MSIAARFGTHIPYVTQAEVRDAPTRRGTRGVGLRGIDADRAKASRMPTAKVMLGSALVLAAGITIGAGQAANGSQC